LYCRSGNTQQQGSRAQQAVAVLAAEQQVVGTSKNRVCCDVGGRTSICIQQLQQLQPAHCPTYAPATGWKLIEQLFFPTAVNGVSLMHVLC
jgi:hypothetical protein